MLRAVIFALFTLLCFASYAQNVAINSSGNPPHVSAGLDVDFSNKGFLTPRLTLAQRTSLTATATKGLLVYQIDNVEGFYYYNGSGWSYLTTSGTSSWALTGNVGNATNFMGTSNAFGIRFRTNNAHRMYIDSIGSVAVGANPTFSASPNREKFLVDAGTTTSFNLISAKGSINSYLQMNIQNTSNGTGASTDIVASNNAATELINYVDLGINSSTNNSGGIYGGANTAYLYSTGNDFSIGNASSGRNLKFFTNGTADTDERMRITSEGLVGIGTGTTAPTERLDVSGKAIFGTIGTSGRLKISNTDDSGITDIFTPDNTMLRLSNSGKGQTGSSLQLKNSSENYLFSFEGKGGFRYYSRNSLSEKFRVNDEGDIYLTTTGENTAVDGKGNIDDFYQINVQNLSGGATASSDIVATNNTADGLDYIDMGINSTGYDNSVGGVSTILNGARATYLYGNGAKMVIGNSARLQPLIFFTNSSNADGGEDARGSERMRINSGGDVIINGPSNGDTNGAGIDDDWDQGNYVLQVNGTLRYSNSSQGSDRQLKTNIQPMSYGLKDIISLKPATYHWIDPKKPQEKQLGLIAQEVREVIPEIVTGDEAKKGLGVEYTALIPVLINAVKEQQKQIEELKQKVEKLQNK